MTKVLDALLIIASVRFMFDPDHTRSLACLAIVLILFVAKESRR